MLFTPRSQQQQLMLQFARRVPVLCTAWDKFLVKAKWTRLSTAPTKSKIIIEKMQESRSKEVLDHVTEVFLRDEPLSKRFPPCTTGQRRRDFQKYAAQQLESGFSVMATDGPGGPVVGACLNKVLPRKAVMGYCPPEPDPSDDLLLPSVTHMLTTIHQQLDLFSLFGLDEILDLGLLSVDPKYTKRGIAKRLMKHSLELGATNGVKAAKTDCSGKVSTKVALRGGMTIIFRLPYLKYTQRGRVVFRSIGDGNNEMTFLAARLQHDKPHVLPVDFQLPCQ